MDDAQNVKGNFISVMKIFAIVATFVAIAA